MKGIICYFSTTGNTEHACRYIASKITSADISLLDIAREKIDDFSNYDIVGIATYTDYWGPPKLVQDFYEKIPKQDGNKAAFLLNAHAGESGKTLMIMRDWSKTKGFKVIGGHSLITPGNFPPALASGWFNEGDPDQESIFKLNEFIDKINELIIKLSKNEDVCEVNISIEEKDMNFPFAVRTAAKEDMGTLYVDKELCSKCGICMKLCPYDAIEFKEELPYIDQRKCYGCWSCYNHCKQKAIYTDSVRGKGQYEGPIDTYLSKLKL